ncbi:hypothetical protein D3C85_1318310 [compost metagenome]
MGRDTDDDQLPDPRLAQLRLQPRRTKRIRHLLLDQAFTGHWLKPFLKLHPRLLRPEYRVLRAGQVLHMDHRPSGASPMAKQVQHARFGLWIIPAAEPGMQDAFLLIDDDQCRVCLELHADCSPGLLSVSHFNIPHCD